MNFKANKTVVINLGSGNLSQGFPQITVRLWADQDLQAEQVVGSLPAAPELVEFYRIWQSTYRAVCSRLVVRLDPSEAIEDDLEIDASGITQVSQQSFEEFSQQLQQKVNTWLKSDGFLNIERQLRSHLNPSDEIRVIFEATDDLLHRLPWHCWEFFHDYPDAEMALSRPEYKRRKTVRSQDNRKQVRILAILGDRRGIDVETERQLLQGLADAEIEFLVAPSRQEFNHKLWAEIGWDILFFAGHSQTERESGRIYINENPVNHSLTIAQLEEALKIAIENGLKLAIFNSCDGVGLAQALGKLQIPQVIVMREPVSNRVAQEFLKYFLNAFATERLPLYRAMRQARRKLQGLEDDFPGASWLPVLYQNPAVEPSTWLQLGGIAPCPYRGLFAFQEADAHLFFGREQVTHDLITAVKQNALVAVIGSSGSGKSSLVFAGLVPRLRSSLSSTGWQILSFRPGIKPFDGLAEALVELLPENKDAAAEQSPLKQATDRPTRLQVLELAVDLHHDRQALCEMIERSHQKAAGIRLLLIVDQFEELYTLCSEAERQTFLDSLLDAVQAAPAFTLVLTLRADFYSYALSDRRLSDALQGAVYNLGPMSREELQTAIAQPAAHMQVKLEPGLTDKLIQATWGHAGRLPLLEFALTELWLQQQAGWLTHQAYEAIGGVEEALANHAEMSYAQLHPIDQQRVQSIFVQLVEPGVGTDPSRRLATRDEVGDANWDLVSQLASARMVVTNRNQATGEETVEIVHEALIRSWGRLKHWLEIDGEFRRWQEDLRRSRRQWEGSDREDESLLRGKLLSDAQYWYSCRQDELSSGDRQFIQLSLALQERDRKRRKHVRRTIVCSLVTGLLGALLLAGVAWWQWQNALVTGVQAIHVSAQAHLSLNQEFDALLSEIRAGSLINGASGMDANTRKDVAGTLLQAISFVKEQNRLENHTNLVESVSFSPDSKTLATASRDNTIKLWSLNGQEQFSFKAHVGGGISSVKFSPSGQLIATASWDHTAKLWDLSGKELRALKGHNDRVTCVAFSPDGKLIGTASLDNTVKIWHLNGQEMKTLTGHENGVNSVAFSPDGKLIATASGDKTIKLWHLDGKLLQTLTGHENGVNSVAFSPDGKLIATASGDKTVKLWHLDGKLLETLSGHHDSVTSVVFSPDSQTLATASSDKTVKLWNLNNQYAKTLQGHRGIVFDLIVSPDGKLIATSSWDGTIKLWSLDGQEIRTFKGHSGRVHRLNFSPDGQLITSPGDDRTVKLWKLDGKELKTLRGHQAIVWNASFSPDGRSIATASEDRTVKLWNLDGKELKTLLGHTDVVNSVAFSPDGHLIASASWDKTVKLWSPDGKELKTLKGHTSGINAVAFSPDGGLIASASWDKTVKLWSPAGKELKTLKGHENSVNSVAFSANGKFIVTASGDNTVKLWSRDGTELETLQGYKDAVWSARFSPDGKTLATSSEDKLIIRNLFLTNLDRLLQLSCDWTSGYLKHNPSANQKDKQFCEQHQFEYPTTLVQRMGHSN